MKNIEALEQGLETEFQELEALEQGLETEFRELFKEFLKDAKWSSMQLPHAVLSQDESALAFQGLTGNSHFLVVSFDIAPQGFPKGSRGYDGTLTDPSGMVRLSRPLAEFIFKFVSEKIHECD
jgi:hypothetical protein